jgi:hypothetical protein
MSTRATIKFIGEDEAYYVYRHFDGYPEEIAPDLHELTGIANDNNLNIYDVGTIVAFFISKYNSISPIKDFGDINYELTPKFHTDESYRYFVTYKNHQWGYIVKHAGEEGFDDLG